MAEPTVWGFTATAGVSTTFSIEGTNLYGVDISGALEPKIVPMGENMHLLLTAPKTLAELVAASLGFARAHGSGRDAAGGATAELTDNSRTPTLTVTS